MGSICTQLARAIRWVETTRRPTVVSQRCADCRDGTSGPQLSSALLSYGNRVCKTLRRTLIFHSLDLGIPHSIALVEVHWESELLCGLRYNESAYMASDGATPRHSLGDTQELKNIVQYVSIEGKGLVKCSSSRARPYIHRLCLIPHGRYMAMSKAHEKNLNTRKTSHKLRTATLVEVTQIV
jgi:hypothetical protein